jgi:D-3-phosphoglycerate dehydrogenase
LKVLVSDPISKEGIEKLSQYYEVDVKTGLSKEELLSIIPRYSALIVRSETKVDRDVIYAGENLKIIGRAGVGVDNIDLDSATERGIIVVNAPEGNTISACEHTFALMLALARNIPDANAALKRLEWKRKEFTGVELYGKTLGIIGLGRIGLAVAQRALSFGMSVIGYDPFITKEKIIELGIQPVSLEELYRRSDFLTLHIPLNQDTRDLINKEAFLKMKKGIRIINCARGGIINEQDLLWAIEEGIVAGAAIDVFEKEPPGDVPILHSNKIIVTPHLGASTVEAQDRVAQIVVEDIIRALKGEPVKNGVNISTIKNPEILQFLRLAELLGRFGSQLVDAPINSIEVMYSGRITSYDYTPVTANAIAGVLKEKLTGPVNIVNALLIARQRGITFSERKTSDTEGFENLITVGINDGSVRVAGTLLENKETRLIRYNNYYLNVSFSDYMLFTEHIDVPGIIGKIGSILGANKINIGYMQVGRSDKDAVMVLSIDSPVDDEILEEIKRIENISLVKRILLTSRNVEED